MYRLVVPLLLASVSACAAGHWIEYKIGPFRIISDAGDKAARDRLNEMEQLRHAVGVVLGKDSLAVGGPSNQELKTIWPIDVVLFENQKQYAPHALEKPFIEGGSAMVGAWTADVPLSREMLRALTRMLIDENAGVMPDSVEQALCDLFSTVKAAGPKVTIGAQPSSSEMTPERIREWAKMQMLATKQEYSGSLRVYLNNLQGGGDIGMASRNAFHVTSAQLDQAADAYWKAGHFEAIAFSSEPINPSRDFIEKQMDKAAVDAILAELAAGGKSFPPDSPRGLVAKGTIAGYELAMKANPRWGEPHFKLAQLQSNPTAKIAELKTAATLEPRNVTYWQTLAQAQTSANQYGDAEKSWTAAMKAAPTDAERERIRLVRIDMAERRAEWEEAEKRRIAEEQARELQRVKDAAAAEVHSSEASINKQLGEFSSDKKPIEWFEDPKGPTVAGRLVRVDCLTGGAMRLTIAIDGAKAPNNTIRLLIRDPLKLTVHDVTGQAKFVCGVQQKRAEIRAVYTVNADAKLNTVGDIQVVELH